MVDAPLPEAPKQPLKGWQKNLIWLGVVTLTGLSSYIAGRVQMTTHIDAAKAETKASEQKAAQQKGEADQRARIITRLEARRQLHLMLLALDARNFGIAKAHQAKAAALLKQSQAEGELAQLASDIDKLELVATEDLSTQRRKVLDWVKRFDQIQPPPS